MLASLPPNQLLRRTRNGTVSYVYADPLVCRCLYVGGQEAYARYQRQAQRERLADEREMAAQLEFDNNWDWQIWGPYPAPLAW